MRRDRTRWCKSPSEMPREIPALAIFPTLQLIVDLLENIMSELSDLQDQVAATVGIEQSAVTLIEGLADKIDKLVAAGGTGGVDPAELVKLKDSLHAQAEALAAAITAGARPDPAPADPGTTPPADGGAAPAGDAPASA
jgi:hypothetical protein